MHGHLNVKNVFTCCYEDEYIKNCEMQKNTIRMRMREKNIHIYSETFKRDNHLGYLAMYGNLSQDKLETEGKRG